LHIFADVGRFGDTKRSRTFTAAGTSADAEVALVSLAELMIMSDSRRALNPYGIELIQSASAQNSAT